MVGQLEKGKADMSTSMMIIRDDRSRVLDFLDAYYRLQTGVLFREPPLASVSNIFLLPFSRDVWIGVVVLTVLIIAALELEAVAGTRRQWRRTRPDHVEIVFSVFYAIAQKSYYWIPVSTAGRLIFFILFTTCLALFTAFSAKIVTVMQSSSSSIDDIEDLTHSSFQFGMQTNFPLFLVTLEDAIPTQRVIREFYREKVMKNMKELYLEPEIGIERIRRGLFAYEVELPAGYTLISETFEEAEKCGIRELDLFPKPYLSTVLPKYSPLRQIFSPRMRWMAETGHTARIWQRWMPQKPKCEMERIGFISVGLLECHHAILIFMYGAAAAVLIMTGEIVYRKVSMRTQQKKGLEARARLSTEITG
ncbi:UNVERIFIED_CONTAM: hypothetical protein PYX00_005108 [Menopon gallinae]|uniref:Ionotropic glutamate receptor C-terminal domain-containing protein n=1 Tax=Menopon gallinae TaxID=328185 RepID=A0AAW2HR60_9NEOP